MTARLASERPRAFAPAVFGLSLALSALLLAPLGGLGFLGDDWLMLEIPESMGGGDVFAYLASYWRTNGYWAGYVRPVEHFFWWLDYVAAGHGAPWVYYATNLLLHAGAATMLALLASALGVGPAAAAFAAVLFTAFPAAAEPVAFLYGRADLVMALFALAALAAYGRYAQTGARGAGAAAWPAALLAAFSKEPGLTVLGAVALLELLYAGGGLAARARRLAPFLAIPVLWFVYRRWSLEGTDFPAPKVALDPVGVARFYGSELPRMLLDPINRRVTPGAPDWIPAAVASALGVLAARWTLRGAPAWRAALVALAIVAAPLLPVTRLLYAAPDLKNYRYLYLSGAGFSLLAAVWLAPRPAARPARLLRGLAAAALLALWALALHQNVRPWRAEQRRAAVLEREYDRLLPEGPPPGATLYLEEDPPGYSGGDEKRAPQGNDALIHVAGYHLIRAPYVLARSRGLRARAIVDGRDCPLPLDPASPCAAWDPDAHDWSGGDRWLLWDHRADRLIDRTPAWR